MHDTADLATATRNPFFTLEKKTERTEMMDEEDIGA